jgi:hypothetical protein
VAGPTLDGDEIAVDGEVVWVAEPVRARRLTEDEGRRLQQIVRRGKHESIRVRRAMIVMASASGTPIPVTFFASPPDGWGARSPGPA